MKLRTLNSNTFQAKFRNLNEDLGLHSFEQRKVNSYISLIAFTEHKILSNTPDCYLFSFCFVQTITSLNRNTWRNFLLFPTFSTIIPFFTRYLWLSGCKENNRFLEFSFGLKMLTGFCIGVRIVYFFVGHISGEYELFPRIMPIDNKSKNANKNIIHPKSKWGRSGEKGNKCSALTFWLSTGLWFSKKCCVILSVFCNMS